jgi:HD-GYP domain-containing protein (c-di-GMP phosphodiesterase class II)
MIIEERGAAFAVICVEAALRRRLERITARLGHATLHEHGSPNDLSSGGIEPDVILYDAERVGAWSPQPPESKGDCFTPVVALVPSEESSLAQQCAEAGAHEVFSYEQVGVPLAHRLRSLLEARGLITSLANNGIGRVELPSRMRALAQTAEAVEDRSGGHTARVASLAAEIALRIGKPRSWAERLRLAALLHDVGKLAIPSLILKKPARLSEWEFAVVQRHTTSGAAMLGEPAHDALMMARTVAETHHERWDGTGYPNGLSGEAIPLEGRIVAVADVFDALTSDRAYKPAWQVGDAVAEIERGAGGQFDPEVARALAALSKEPGFRRTVALR